MSYVPPVIVLLTFFAFPQDGSYFASGGADQLVMVWKSNFLSPAEEESARFQHNTSNSAPHAALKSRSTQITQKSKPTPLTANAQRSSSNRLSKSTVNINQSSAAPRHLPPQRQTLARPSGSVQLTSHEDGQRSINSATAAALQSLPPPPYPRSSGDDSVDKPPSSLPNPSAEKMQPPLDRNTLPPGLVETMDHIVGQVRSEII